MSTVCVIPARYESARFPGKLLVDVLGKPLLQRTFESALRAPSLSKVYIATHNEQIHEQAKIWGASVLRTSSKPLNGTERIVEALQHTQALQQAEIILNLQGDHPCTPPKTIDAVIQALRDHPECAVATAARPIANWEEFCAPQVVKCLVDAQGKALYFSRSPIPYHLPGAPLTALAHLGLYAYRPSVLQKLSSFPQTPLQKQEDLEQLQFLELGFPIAIAIVEEGSLSVDVPQDLQILKRVLCQR